MTQSKSSMSFVTQSKNFILDSNNTELENFWHNQQLNFEVTKNTKILSFACQIPTVDPLACLQQFSSADTLHFYWENCSKQEAVAAWGVTRSEYTKSNSRFSLAQNFIHECFKKIIRVGENIASGKPSVFCSFTFFADPNTSEPFTPISNS
jgi:menaquinone-specific isochorismate synthase